MKLQICPLRQAILNSTDHVVVTGGPGCGKTTIALAKAMARVDAGLLPGQQVLFLSFSRAAVARLVEAARSSIPTDRMEHLDIQTFHSFYWKFVRGHGYLLGARRPLTIMPPHDERAFRNGKKEETPEWNAQREELFLEEGRVVLDLFSKKSLVLLKRSKNLRELFARKYPLIIVDEAQDTGREQWGCVAALAKHTKVVCLADMGQQIFEFRADVSRDRMNHILRALNTTAIDIGGINNRSPNSEIVQFGNDIVNITPRGSSYKGISHYEFNPKAAHRDNGIRKAVGILRRYLVSESGKSNCSIGYLTRTHAGVTVVARALQGGNGAKEIPHRVFMDEVQVLLATRVIALCLEPVQDIWKTLEIGLNLISEMYRSKGNSAKVKTLVGASTAASNRKLGSRAKCPPKLKEIIEKFQTQGFSGDPKKDWLAVRKEFEESGVAELKEISKNVMYLMAYNRGRRIGDLLSDSWLTNGAYLHARNLIESALVQSQIVDSDDSVGAINVMNTHKSKGKEFDGVILLHIKSISDYCHYGDAPLYNEARRLFRVGVTRARYHTLLLTDASAPSDLLNGHNLMP